MTIRPYGAGLLTLGFALWVGSGSQREKAVMGSGPFARLHALEDAAASHPEDCEPTRALAQAYLDARQPGLAASLIEGAPRSIGADVRVSHLRARALIDEGRNGEALAVEEGVVAACLPRAEDRRADDGCDSVLLASALRRNGILRELVLLGIDDAQAHPEESLVAYLNATREARVMLQ